MLADLGTKPLGPARIKELCALRNLKAMREEAEQSRLNKAVVTQPDVDKWIRLLVILIMITGCRAQGNQQPEEEKIDLAAAPLGSRGGVGHLSEGEKIFRIRAPKRKVRKKS